jgi:hypothetical protein
MSNHFGDNAMQRAKTAQEKYSYEGKLRRLGSHNIEYTIREVWPKMLEHITEGKSLMSATKEAKMSYATAMYQLRNNPELQSKYREAIAERGDYLADELVDLSDEMPPADLDPQLINAWVNRQRLRIDARKWTASKLRPKQWGDKIDVSVTHTQISINEALKSAESRLIDNVTDITPNNNDEV